MGINSPLERGLTTGQKPSRTALRLSGRGVFPLLLDLLFPKECILCGAHGAYACADCLSRITLCHYEFCPACRRRSFVGETHEQCRAATALDGIVVSAHWPQPTVRELIHAYKYTPLPELAGPMAAIVHARIRAHPLLSHKIAQSDLCIVPVPLHPGKERQRGFNQSASLVDALGMNSACIQKDALKRRYNISQQARVSSRQKRIERTRGIFSLTPSCRAVSQKHVLLFDDLVTTGATLNECARLLKRAGARSVWAVTLAHG